MTIKLVQQIFDICGHHDYGRVLNIKLKIWYIAIFGGGWCLWFGQEFFTVWCTTIFTDKQLNDTVVVPRKNANYFFWLKGPFQVYTLYIIQALMLRCNKSMPCHTIQYLTILYSTTEYHRIPCNTMQYCYYLLAYCSIQSISHCTAQTNKCINQKQTIHFLVRTHVLLLFFNLLFRCL